jgi:hypothetical protein
MNQQQAAQEAIMGGRDSLAGKRPANLTISAQLLDKARGFFLMAPRRLSNERTMPRRA